MNSSKGIISQKIGKKDVFYDPGTSELYTFNKIGRRIFELALSGMSERDIVKEIVKDYDVTQKNATEDVTSFLKVLYKKKLLK